MSETKYDKRKIKYEAFFFEDPDQIAKDFKTPYKNVFCHHTTISYLPEDLINEDLLGISLDVVVTGRLTTDKVDLLIVKDADYIEKKDLHITLSTVEGVEPKYSNEAIKENRDKIVYYEEEILLPARYGYYDGNNIVYEK